MRATYSDFNLQGPSMTKSLSDSERIDWIQLIRTQNIGPVSFFRLIKKFGTASNALEMLPEFSRLVAPRLDGRRKNPTSALLKLPFLAKSMDLAIRL